MTEKTKKKKMCVSEIDVKDVPEGVFTGRLGKDELRVSLAPGAHQAMVTHAKSSKDAEVCGVMLGALKKDAQGPFLAIEDVIEGLAAQSEAARVTYTPDSWEHIFKEQEQRDPNLKMIGWYHTHPRFGIFLSTYDRFIHQNFFGVEPWMVAFVIDPVREEEGFFYWSDGEIKRLPRYWIGTQPRKSDGAEFEGRKIQDDHQVTSSSSSSSKVEVKAKEKSKKATPKAAPGGMTPMLPPNDEEPPLLPSAQTLVLFLLVLWMLNFGYESMFGTRNERRIMRLQEKTILYQSDMALELRDIRAATGLPPTNRQSLKELEKIAEEVEKAKDGDKTDKTDDDKTTTKTSNKTEFEKTIEKAPPKTAAKTAAKTEMVPEPPEKTEAKTDGE